MQYERYLEMEHPGVRPVSDLGDRVGVRHLCIERHDGPRPARCVLLFVSYGVSVDGMCGGGV